MARLPVILRCSCSIMAATRWLRTTSGPWRQLPHRKTPTGASSRTVTQTIRVRTATGRVGSRIYPVFRDRSVPSGRRGSGKLIVDALDRSRYLVVLCSPRAVESRICLGRVLHFQRTASRTTSSRPSSTASRRSATGMRSRSTEASGRRVRPVGSWRRKPSRSQRIFECPTAPRASPPPKPTGCTWPNGTLDKRQVKSRRDAFELHLQSMKLKILSGGPGRAARGPAGLDKYQLEIARRRSRVLRRWLMAVGTLAVLLLVAGLKRNQQRIRAEIQQVRGVAADAEDLARAGIPVLEQRRCPSSGHRFLTGAALGEQIMDHPNSDGAGESRRGAVGTSARPEPPGLGSAHRARRG